MNEEMLFAYRQQEGPFLQWVVEHQELVEQVTRALVTLHHRDGSCQLADLQACRDAAQTIHTIAYSAGFEDVAALFSLQYEHFSRAMLHLFRQGL